MLQTPRQVIAEAAKSKEKPWWANKLLRDMTEHLESIKFRGRALIDEPMSAEACEAVLEEAVEVCSKPSSDLYGDVMRDLERLQQ